jgi:hypothetical protein
MLMPWVARNVHDEPGNVKFLEAFTDFSASAVSTVACSVVSTPQMVLTDRLMAGVYSSFPEALTSIFKSEGLRGFYAGWWPGKERII